MEKIDNILKEMTLEEKAQLLTGKDFWQTRDFERMGIPSLILSDGPHGLRKQEAAADHLGFNPSVPATCFPTAATMANSWDEKLGERMGEALGKEAAAQNVSVLLGPGTCMKRNPRCGRNFEYFSEDPYLAGKMSAAMIRGIQSNGTAACVKHFAANNQEERRMVSDSIIDERALREIYLTAFEIAIKEGKSRTIMSAYNKVNGTFADENEHLIRDILRGEWGFDGVVISDWAGCNNKVASTQNGSDLEMPACKYGTDDLIAAVKSGELDESYLDESCRRVLSLISDAEKVKKGVPFDKTAHHELANECARESIVLLKNDGTLPLKRQKVALIGDFAKLPRYQGAGSSVVNPTSLESMESGILDYDCEYVGYEQGFHRYGKTKRSLIKRAVKLASKSDTAILCLGLDEMSEVEGLDRENIAFPANQIELLKAVAATGKKVVVVLHCGSAVTTDWSKYCNGLVYACLSGQSGARAILDVVFGKANPCGKLAESFPKSYGDCPTANYFPGKINTVEYRESLFIGYRYYDKSNVEVAFPFGYGLSYTKFDYSELQLSQTGVSFKLKNVGNMDGSEICQLYVKKAESDLFRPEKELKGFKKVFLKVGEEREVKIDFDDKTFRYFSVATDKWEIEGGEYEILIAANSKDIRLSDSLKIDGTTDAVSYQKDRLLSYYSGDIKSVSEEEFEELLGRDIPQETHNFYKKKRMIIHENCTVADLRYSKRWVGRFFAWAIRFAIGFCRAFNLKSNANTLVMGVLHQPIRGLAKYGSMTRKQMEGLLNMFNGKLFKGIGMYFSRSGK